MVQNISDRINYRPSKWVIGLEMATLLHSLKITYLLKIGLPKRKVVFQPSIFRGYVSFREGKDSERLPFFEDTFHLRPLLDGSIYPSILQQDVERLGRVFLLPIKLIEKLVSTISLD